MEINLELPSREQEKLKYVSNTNPTDIKDGPDDIERGINLLPIEHDIKPCGPTEDEGITGDEIQLDKDRAAVNIAHRGATMEPQYGLKFETKEAAYSFYREYAQSVGFGITIKASRRSKRSGKFIDVKIACSRFGNKRESNATINPRSCIKTDCKAGMHMKRTQDDKWIIHSFVKEHNHEICPDDLDNTLRGRNKQSSIVACRKKGLQLALDEDDVQAMLEHFMCMQAEDPNFFYSIDMDNEKCMKTVFWIDAKGRCNYKSFCDVIFLDTFYLGSKYRIPYVPIIGVNHHFQFILLGCSLIGEQTTSSFAWLMRTWLKAVGSLAPRVIITDQDKILKEAVADVFPDTRHCYGLWHVLSRMPENICGVIDQNELFMQKFNKCIYRSWTKEQFEKRWWKIVDKFKLWENDWACSLFEDRKMWVPSYMQDIFLAGMSTKNRAGSVASFFEKYIHKETTFKDFMEKYNTFLKDRCEIEFKADFETQNKLPSIRSISSFEKQMSAIYTDAIFKKFQAEALGIVSCHLQKESEYEATVNFRVDDFEEHQFFLVAWNEAALNISCSCRSFEYRGILCKHTILVLQMSGVSNIPSHYILKRWTKDAKISQTVSELSNTLHWRVQRFNDICKLAVKLGEEGSLSQEAYDIAHWALETALENCVGANNSVKSVSRPDTLALHGFLGIEEHSSNSVAKSSKKRKLYKKKEKTNTRPHNVDNYYVLQPEMQEMALGSRAPTLDGYYGSQQSVSSVGQLHSVSPIHHDYYSCQQGLPGLVVYYPVFCLDDNSHRLI
uniref:Protein FAR1-RELATED SEQUENCE n=1 Tax=Rhizophora mucronata TaxID=61149 RepID=A0A2P2J9U5_RHIMU